MKIITPTMIGHFFWEWVMEKESVSYKITLTMSEKNSATIPHHRLLRLPGCPLDAETGQPPGSGGDRWGQGRRNIIAHQL